jgi:hypothetical protein
MLSIPARPYSVVDSVEKPFQKFYDGKNPERRRASSPSSHNDSFRESYLWDCTLECRFEGEKACGTGMLNCLT